MTDRVPGYAGQSGEDRAPGRYGAKVSSMCMPSQPQRWNEWSDRLEREERGNARWREKWPSYRPEDPVDLPWQTALRRSKALTSPRGLGASANWSLPDATALRSTITGLPVQAPFTPEPARTLPSLMQSTIRENALLTKRLTRRHTRRSNFAMKSMNSLSYDMVWDEQLVRCLPDTRRRACTPATRAHPFLELTLRPCLWCFAVPPTIVCSSWYRECTTSQARTLGVAATSIVRACDQIIYLLRIFSLCAEAGRGLSLSVIIHGPRAAHAAPGAIVVVLVPCQLIWIAVRIARCAGTRRLFRRQLISLP